MQSFLQVQRTTIGNDNNNDILLGTIEGWTEVKTYYTICKEMYKGKEIAAFSRTQLQIFIQVGSTIVYVIMRN